MRSATAVELSPTAASWSRMSASRSSSALPTGPKMVLSRITMRSRNSVAMMGRVRLKSKILPGSPAMEGIATSALVTAAMTAGFTDLGSSTLLLDGKIHETRDAGKDGQPRRGRREERRVPRVVGASRARARRFRTIHGSDVPFTATSGTRERRARREPPYPLLHVRARREKAASVAEWHRFPRTHPNLATGATAAARARTVLRAAETLAPARKRHWTAEIADIVAGGCECGYEAGRLSRFRLGARARRITLRQNECHESRSRQRLSQSSSSISSERTRPVEFENSSQDSSEGSIGDLIGKSARRFSEARRFFS